MEPTDEQRRRRERVVLIGDSSSDAVGFTADRSSPRPHSLEGRLSVQDGRLVLTELTLRAADGVDSLLLRVRLGDLLAELRARLAESIGMAYVDVGGSWGHRQDQEAARNTLLGEAAGRSEPKRGRTGYPDTHYRRIARRYLELVNGQPPVTRGVLQVLAAEEERPVETVRTWIHQARQRRFLSPGERGRAGGMPGPLLDQEAP
jgi:hypothetical protein